jgi:hypothetical protein
MKNLTILLLLSLFTINTNAQLPKGDRVLAWQVDVTQNDRLDSAITYAQVACMESIHYAFSWNLMEPTAGNFDQTYLNNSLGISDAYFTALGIKLELNIPTMNTVVKEVPADLLSIDFDDPVMINRFKIILDTIFSRLPNLELSALNIGNESDIFMGTDALQYNAYKTFLDSVVPYAKMLYFNIHNDSLKVGTTLTHAGLINVTQAPLCHLLNSDLDIVSTTYYPLNNDFTMKSPTVVNTDFSDLVTEYPDTAQPIYFVECGYSTSTVCNSTESLQSDFFINVFTAWDTYQNNIKYLTIYKTTDWSHTFVDDLAIHFGTTDTIFKEYLRTLGVRTFPVNGMNKIAYETILCELNARGWCSVNCATTGVNEKAKVNSFKIYPNPTNGLINISTETPIKQIDIYTNLGKLSLSTEGTSINISELPKGMYYMSILLQTGELKVKKLIKH